jgi:hypothetical protein
VLLEDLVVEGFEFVFPTKKNTAGSLVETERTAKRAGDGNSR